MNNSEQDNPNFEEEWRRAFEEPELNPSDRVWAGLNHHLEGKVRQRRRRRFAYVGLAASCLLCLTWGITTWNNNSISENAMTTLPSAETNQSEKSIDKNYTQTNKKGLTSLQPERDSSALAGHSKNQNRQVEAVASSESLSHPTILPQDQTGQTEEGKLLGVAEKSKTKLTEPRNNQAIALALPQSLNDEKKAPSHSMLTETDHQAANSQNKALKRTFGPSSIGYSSQQKNEQALPKDKAGRQGEKLEDGIGVETSSLALAKEENAENSTVGNERKGMAFLPTTTIGSLLVSSNIAEDRLLQQPPVQVLFPQLTEEELAAQKQKEARPPSRWISSTFTPNYFDSNVQAAYQPSSSVNTANSTLSNFYSNSAQRINKVQQDEDVSTPVFSYTAGVSAGTNLAKRWTVEAGVQYINNSTDLQTHAYLQNTATSKKYPIIADLLGASTDAIFAENSAASLDNKLQNNPVATELNPSSTPITLRNQYQSIGIPIELGYKFYQKKKLDLVISAGISTDFFLRNTIKSSEANVSATVISSGENSAYKAVNFSGLLGFGVHYLYSSRFSITVEPNYRASLFSTTKIASNVQTLPRNIGLGLGIKYHF